MATEFKLPELGEGVASGTVANILVKAGDAVSPGQPVIEIETDKAVAEIPINVGGTIKDIKVKTGQSVKAGDIIFVLDGEGAAAPAKAAPVQAAPEPAPAKVAAPVPAPAPATVHVAAPVSAAPAPPIAEGARPAGANVLASPSVRKLARSLGVKLHEVPTADSSGRVSEQDVLAFAASSGKAPVSTPAAASVSGAIATPVSAAPVLPADARQELDRWGAVAIEPMNAVRKKTTEHMTRCWTTIPHVTHFEKADITELEALRQKRGAAIKAQGGSLTVTCFIMKIVAEGLKRFPKFNASIDLDNQEVALKQYYHIGVAVETPIGLLVPSIRDVDKKSVTQIAMELPAIAKKARDRKLSLEEMQGSTFTISNLGGIGGVGFTPIINAPEVAILGVSRASVEPVYINGQFAARTMMPLSLSYDHRLIDGADAARFLRWVVEALENPWVLFLEG
ncbi:MAG: 2-oxo acid dehydrogenase subunit E2 [Candidatus Hydrogenedentes bacterium]|nr:2-oxo acid dehydrogenase subunit E2 [Candidatus Hydrogenedentota bacterium]